MSKLSKINHTQKEILGNFMEQHPDLAKNFLLNSVQGKAKWNQLWEQLTLKLNAAGPPIRDTRTWRKVYADQKQHVKRKISFNKLSKEKKIFSHAEQQILIAAGIESDDLNTVEMFSSEPANGSSQDTTNNMFASNSSSHNLRTSPWTLSDNEDVEHSILSILESEQDEISMSPNNMNQNIKESKNSLLNNNLMSPELYQKGMLERLDKIIEIKNKKLQLKENEIELKKQLVDIKMKSFIMKEREQHLNTQIREMELVIRKMEMESLTRHI